MTRLAQVKAARAAAAGVAESLQEAEDIRGRHVLTAYAPVTAPGWLVFVELPVNEAYAPIIESIERSGLLLLLGLALAVLAGVFLARRMVVPIQALQAGAARIGSGDLGQRISIKTGDELEAWAINSSMAASSRNPMRPGTKVEERTTRWRNRSRSCGRWAGQPGGEFHARPETDAHVVAKRRFSSTGRARSRARRGER